MKFSSKVSKENSAGFIISLELLLVLTLVVFPMMLGMFLLGRKLVTLYLNYQAAVVQPLSRPVIFDSSSPAKVVGPVIGYDEFAAPLVLYRDATFGSSSPGVLLGVRPNRFTTVSKVYYKGDDCDGDAYLKTPSSAPLVWQYVGFLYQLQGVNYAIGNGNVLHRATALGAGQENISSVWTSLDTGDDSPAEFPSSACNQTDLASEDHLVLATSVAQLATNPGPATNFVTPFKLAFAKVAP